MKEKRRHGKGADAQVDENSEKIMEEIRKEAKTYPADCVYNIDETGKYWKMKPD